MNETCALDVADHGEMTLEDVGDLMNFTRENARQIEVKAFAQLEAALDKDPKRHLPIVSAG